MVAEERLFSGVLGIDLLFEAVNESGILVIGDLLVLLALDFFLNLSLPNEFAKCSVSSGVIYAFDDQCKLKFAHHAIT